MHVVIDGRRSLDVEATADEIRQLVVNAAHAAMDSGSDPDEGTAFMKAWDEQIDKAVRESGPPKVEG